MSKYFTKNFRMTVSSHKKEIVFRVTLISSNYVPETERIITSKQR